MDNDKQTILGHLQRNEGLTLLEAIEEFQDMRKRVLAGEDPEEILHEIGLEPDYVLALI